MKWKELDQKRGLIEAIEWTVFLIVGHIMLALIVDSAARREVNHRMQGNGD